MAKKKTEEVIDPVETEEVTETIDTAETNATEDKKEPIERSTPFGIEVWDPETKTTTMKPNG